jgi:hypothetical protein
VAISQKPQRFIFSLIITSLLSYSLVATKLDAQGESLSYGDQIVDYLRENETLQYDFRANAGDAVSIQLTADQRLLDARLELYSPSGDLITSNDDFDGLNPAILGEVLDQQGIYVIIVRPVCATSVRFWQFYFGAFIRDAFTSYNL